ncbi:acyltransferase [Ferruginibacter sp. HRS2-29]|uniref:acyltransferase family protein n=1 Tax=Ferruginibacter sp. HRS2-29 TaxID=2487334 RepID=UPI0020CDA9CB|nr:acyltransferase [Ferruginibacter sp. HRS2-29]MCP9750113.1 acyltransferase [Ferruginibacter sp. HRS2-29]
MKRTSPVKTDLSLLHAIRGVAAMYVVVYHAKFIMWCGGAEYLKAFPRAGWNPLDYVIFLLDMLFSSGSQMVMIFFVLSGFFIAMSLEGLKGTPGQKVRNFYTVRILRIYIPYLASILVSVLVLYWASTFAPDLFNTISGREFNTRLVAAVKDLTFSNFLQSLLFTKNQEYIGFNYAYWSLLHEGLFYLSIPFIYQFRRSYLACSFLLFLAGALFFYNSSEDDVFIKFLFEYNFYFAVGITLYTYRDVAGQIITKRNFKWPILICCFFLTIGFIALTIAKVSLLPNILAVMTAVLLMLLLLNYEIGNTIFVKMIKSLGKISYSLYLIHVPVLIAVMALLNRYTGKQFFYGHVYWIGVLASLLAGYAFYRIAEGPSLRLISSLKKRLRKEHQADSKP